MMSCATFIAEEGAEMSTKGDVVTCELSLDDLGLPACGSSEILIFFYPAVFCLESKIGCETGSSH